MGLMKKPAAPVSKAVSKTAGKPLGAAKKLGSARRSDDDDDDDERPRKTGATKKASSRNEDGSAVGATKAQRGWGAADKVQAESSSWANTLKIEPKEPAVIRFLEDEPYASIKVHWLERNGRRSFICIGKGCPLCGVGDNPRPSYRFNIIKLTDGEPIHLTWDAGASIFNKIKEKHLARTGPLSKRFYLASKSGGGGKGKGRVEYNLEVFRRDEDIHDEYPDINIPDMDDVMETVELHTPEMVDKERVTKAALDEIADEMTADD